MLSKKECLLLNLVPLVDKIRKKLRCCNYNTFFIFGPSGCGKTSCIAHALKAEQYLPIIWNLAKEDEKEYYKKEITNLVQNECIRTFFKGKNCDHKKGNALVILHLEKIDQEFGDVLKITLDKINYMATKRNNEQKNLIPIILTFHIDNQKNKHVLYKNILKCIIKKCQNVIKIEPIEKNHLDQWIHFQIEKEFRKNDKNKIIELLDQITKQQEHHNNDTNNLHYIRENLLGIKERIKIEKERKVNIQDMFMTIHNNKKRKRNDDDNSESKYYKQNKKFAEINANNCCEIQIQKTKKKISYNDKIQEILKEYMNQIKNIFDFSDYNKRQKNILEKEKQKTKKLTDLIFIK